LVADHQVLAAGWSVAIERLVDFAVGGVDPHLQDLNADRAPFRNATNVRVRLIAQLGFRHVHKVNAVGLAGEDGYGFHRKVDPSRNEAFSAHGPPPGGPEMVTILA